MNNEMKLTIKALSENVSFVRNAVAAFCVTEEPTLATIDDIKTAVSEAVTNVVVHAYKNTKEGIIEIESLLSDGLLTIIVKDNGIGIDNIEQAMNEFFTTQTEEGRAGLGFTIMKTYMDTLKVESKVGAGTTVIMTKKLLNA